MSLSKYNAQTKCRHCRKFRWGFMTFDENMSAVSFLCGTCEKVTYYESR